MTYPGLPIAVPFFFLVIVASSVVSMVRLGFLTLFFLVLPAALGDFIVSSVVSTARYVFLAFFFSVHAAALVGDSISSAYIMSEAGEQHAKITFRMLIFMPTSLFFMVQHGLISSSLVEYP